MSTPLEKLGAIILYGNAADRATFVGDGRITDQENLFRPQLQPKASFLGFTVMEFQWDTPEEIHAVCLWGLSQLSVTERPIITVERWTGSNWEELDHRLLVSEQNNYSLEHVIAILSEPVSTQRLRVTPAVGLNELSIGSLQIAKMIMGLQIADAGWTFAPVDTSVTDFSQGGQPYSRQGAVRRQVNVQQGTIDQDLFYGLPRDQVPVPLGSPTITGDWIADGNGYALAAGESVDVIDWGALTSGKHYILEYDYSVTGNGADVSAPPLLEIPQTPGLDLQPGRRTLHFTDDGTGLQIVGSTPGPASIRLEILSLAETSTPPPSTSLPRSFDEVLALTGNSNPIGLVLYPNSPALAKHSTFYGLPTFSQYTDNDGQIKAGGFSLIESL